MKTMVQRVTKLLDGFNMSIDYRGERFSGYNKPKRSRKGGKKVCCTSQTR